MRITRAGILVCLLAAVLCLNSAAFSDKSKPVVTKLSDLESTPIDFGKTIKEFATADENDPGF